MSTATGSGLLSGSGSGISTGNPASSSSAAGSGGSASASASTGTVGGGGGGGGSDGTKPPPSSSGIDTSTSSSLGPAATHCQGTVINHGAGIGTSSMISSYVPSLSPLLNNTAGDQGQAAAAAAVAAVPAGVSGAASASGSGVIATGVSNAPTAITGFGGGGGEDLPRDLRALAEAAAKIAQNVPLPEQDDDDGNSGDVANLKDLRGELDDDDEFFSMVRGGGGGGGGAGGSSSSPHRDLTPTVVNQASTVVGEGATSTILAQSYNSPFLSQQTSGLIVPSVLPGAASASSFVRHETQNTSFGSGSGREGSGGSVTSHLTADALSRLQQPTALVPATAAAAAEAAPSDANNGAQQQPQHNVFREFFLFADLRVAVPGDLKNVAAAVGSSRHPIKSVVMSSTRNHQQLLKQHTEHSKTKTKTKSSSSQQQQQQQQHDLKHGVEPSMLRCISPFHTIKQVVLYGLKIHSSLDLKLLPPTVDFFSIRGCEGEFPVGEWPDQSCLSALTIADNVFYNVLTSAILAQLPKTLHQLRLSDNSLVGENLRLEVLPPELERLSMSRNHIGPLLDLAGMGDDCSEINLSCNMLQSVAGLDRLPAFLCELDLSGNPQLEGAFPFLSLPPPLQSLDISHTKMSGVLDPAALFRRRCRQMVSFVANGCNLQSPPPSSGSEHPHRLFELRALGRHLRVFEVAGNKGLAGSLRFSRDEEEGSDSEEFNDAMMDDDMSTRRLALPERFCRLNLSCCSFSGPIPDLAVLAQASEDLEEVQLSGNLLLGGKICVSDLPETLKLFVADTAIVLLQN